MNLPDLELAKEYLGTLPIVVAYVFGSRVSGNSRPDSDLDIAIVPDDGVEIDYHRQAEIEYQLQQRIKDVEIQLTVLRPKSSPLISGKVIQGMPLIVKKPLIKNQYQVDTFKRYIKSKRRLAIQTKYLVNSILEEVPHAHR